MADIQPGDVVVDPMCGGASIGIEVCNILPFCLRVSVHMYDCVHKINDLCTSSHLHCVSMQPCLVQPIQSWYSIMWVQWHGYTIIHVHVCVHEYVYVYVYVREKERALLEGEGGRSRAKERESDQFLPFTCRVRWLGQCLIIWMGTSISWPVLELRRIRPL
jgi:hypothetical protein